MEQNHNMLRGISENGGIVFYGVDSTEIVREMERLHKTSAVTTAALGRLLTAASMMGIMLKSTQDSVTLQIKGGGPAGRLLAVSDGTGNVKGYVEHPVVELQMCIRDSSMLASVVSEGIGSEAQPKTGTAGGKTGTAQTGQYDENGEELLNYWFSGFYPADDPRYTITVLQDGILKPENSSAAIFAKVTEILAVWENS